MYDSGIDVIYAAAGGSGDGLFEAALESGKEPGEIYAIGVDSDQYEAVAPELQPYILTSALKRVDVATYEAITDMLNGELTGETKVYDAANNGVGYAVSNEAINQYAGTLEELKAQIIDGTIVVPDDAGRLSPDGPDVGEGAGSPAPSPVRLDIAAVTATGGQIAAIELRDIVKRFPGVVANDGVNLSVMPGTIHAIVGENGAGKSTLMKILYGAQRPDEGRILVNGLEQHFRSPRDAIDDRHRHGVPALHAGRQPDGVGERRSSATSPAPRSGSTSAPPASASSSWAGTTACRSTPTSWWPTSVSARSSGPRS